MKTSNLILAALGLFLLAGIILTLKKICHCLPRLRRGRQQREKNAQANLKARGYKISKVVKGDKTDEYDD